MQKQIKKIIQAFVVILFGFYFLAPNSAFAGEILDVLFQTGENPLFANANFLPGEEVVRWVTVANKTAENQPIAVKAIAVLDDGLSEQMRLAISVDNNTLYNEILSDFFSAGEVFLSDLPPNSSLQYDFKINFLEQAGNEYQNRQTRFDIIVGSQAGESIGGESGTSGGGFQFSDLMILNENIVVNNTTASISWLTNKLATSRVIYDTVSHPDISGFTPPNYGYQFSTIEDSTKVAGHNVEISGLMPGTVYYFRPLSKASPEKFGQELSFMTTDSIDKVVVLGEIGEAKLRLEKTAEKSFANPGVKGVAYSVKVFNDGNLTAFAVSLVDVLPNGFTFSNSTETKKNWELGDIEPKGFKSISYAIDIASELSPGVYTNHAEVYALNHSQVKASANLEIKKIFVLSADNIKSGFSNKEFFGIIFILLLSVGAAYRLRKKN